MSSRPRLSCSSSQGTAHVPWRTRSLWCAPLLALLAVACAGGGPARSTLPQEELSLLELAPRDAFFAGRLDVGALRGTPHWEAVLEQIRAEEPALAELADGTHHVFFAVGGLVEAPPVPPAWDGEGDYRSPPAWADIANALGGHIPAAVALVHGRGAQLCAQMMEQADIREQSGYRIAEKDGIAVMMNGPEFCALTWAPLVSTLLAQSGAPAAIAASLGADGATRPEGGNGIAQLALQLDAPALSTLIDHVGRPNPNAAPPPEYDEETIYPEGEGPSEEELERRRQEREEQMQAMREMEERRGRFSQALTRILAHGLVAVQWQLAQHENGFETRTRVHADDAPRGAMWRELTAMFFDILRAIVEHEVLPMGHRSLSEFVRDLRIEETSDGYVIVRHTTHESISRLLEAFVPEPMEEAVATMADPDYEEVSAIENQMYVILSGSAPQIIAAVEPNLEHVRGIQEFSARANLLVSLAWAYATLGRYADAQALLTVGLADMRDYQAGDGEEHWVVESAHENVCSYAIAACELYLEQGDAEAALAATTTLNPRTESACQDSPFGGRSCAAAAMSMLGRTDEALSALESANQTPNAMVYLKARMRVLMLAGRHADAYSTARPLCVGGPAGNRCDIIAVELAESLAASASTLAAAEPTLSALMARHPFGREQLEVATSAVRIEAADCAARARLAASAQTSVEACARTLEHARQVHGDNHPQVAAIRQSYARTLQSTRQRTQATEQNAAAQAIVETLGPQHPLRARPSRRR